MRFLSVAWLLPLLLFSQSAEAARVSFATENCGTPPLLGLEFGIDGNGTSVLLNASNGCPTGPGDIPGDAIPGDLVGDDGSPFYGTTITNLDLTIASNEDLTGQYFEEGDFFEGSLGFSFSFAASSGGGVLSITFDSPIVLPCTPVAEASFCTNLDLLIYIEGIDDAPLPSDSIVRVTQVNDVAVPEPATLTLLGLGLAAAAVRRRRVTVGKWGGSQPAP